MKEGKKMRKHGLGKTALGLAGTIILAGVVLTALTDKVMSKLEEDKEEKKEDEE